MSEQTEQASNPDLAFAQSFNARDWAEAFMRYNAEFNIASDVEIMTIWFVNAIMRGYDEGGRTK